MCACPHVDAFDGRQTSGGLLPQDVHIVQERTGRKRSSLSVYYAQSRRKEGAARRAAGGSRSGQGKVLPYPNSFTA